MYTSQSSAARSIGPSSRPSPVVLTPTGGISPSGSFAKPESATKAAYMDLDKFYEDTEEPEESDESESEDSDGDEEGSESGEEDEQTGALRRAW